MNQRSLRQICINLRFEFGVYETFVFISIGINIDNVINLNFDSELSKFIALISTVLFETVHSHCVGDHLFSMMSEKKKKKEKNQDLLIYVEF